MNIRKILFIGFISISIMSCNSSKIVTFRLSDDEVFRFDSLFTEWKHNWLTDSQTQLSSNTDDGKKLEEYSKLKTMGGKIIPLVIAKLINEDNFFALPLYDDLQKDEGLKPKNTLDGEQQRARETIANYMDVKLKEEQINKDNLEQLKANVPYTIEKYELKTTLRFIPNAQVFSLDMKRKNADICLYLLEESKNMNTPVRIYLFSNTNNIAFVDVASEEEIKQHKESKDY